MVSGERTSKALLLFFAVLVARCGSSDTSDDAGDSGSGGNLLRGGSSGRAGSAGGGSSGTTTAGSAGRGGSSGVGGTDDPAGRGGASGSAGTLDRAGTGGAAGADDAGGASGAGASDAGVGGEGGGSAGSGNVCESAVDAEPCEEEGEVCGSEACSDPCLFCSVLRCEAGVWKRYEAAPAPCFDCGASERCMTGVEYCSIDRGAAVVEECVVVPELCRADLSCECLEDLEPERTCTETGEGELTLELCCG
jgi:hypothetical protein